MSTHILIIDDKPQIYESLKKNFNHFGYDTHYAENTLAAEKTVLQNTIDTILLDIRLGEESGIETLKKLKKLVPKIPVIMITGFASIDTAVESMRHGAYDYVKKPLNFDRLFKVVENAVELFKLNKENTVLKQRLEELVPKIYVDNPRMLSIIEQAAKIARTDIPILITGENGCGKEVVADYIHANSGRFTYRMHKINCAAFPETLLDNELFGHERGAYTGADDDFMGVFERAHGSTLFLDEIGDMPMSIQAKILRVLQNNEIRRIGGTQIRKIDVRFIAATNKNPEELIREGKFRQDLFYRLNTALLYVPPLRERREDIPLLAQFFLQQFAVSQGKQGVELSEEVLHLFNDHSWPGNVRELRNAVNFGVSIASGNLVKIEDLPPSLKQMESSAENTASQSILADMEKDLIVKTLTQCRFNKKKTAEKLKISRKTLYKKIEKYGISN